MGSPVRCVGKLAIRSLREVVTGVKNRSLSRSLLPIRLTDQDIGADKYQQPTAKRLLQLACWRQTRAVCPEGRSVRFLTGRIFATADTGVRNSKVSNGCRVQNIPEINDRAAGHARFDLLKI